MAKRRRSAKVFSLRGGEIVPPGVPKENVIKLCEDLLERARSGDLRAVSVVMGHSDDTYSFRHEGPVVYGTVGACATLQHWIAREVLE